MATRKDPAETQYRTAAPKDRPYKIFDGGGLFLLIQPNGSKLWRQAYRFDNKQQMLSHGAYPTVGLADARKRREAVKVLLASGIDPSKHRKAEKRQAKVAADNTFASVADEWFKAKQGKWTPAYSERLWRRLEGDILPTLGKRPIADIEPPEVLEAVRKVEKRNAIVLARRLKQVCGQIFRYAVANGLVKSDPTRDLSEALAERREQKHRAAIKAADLGPFLRSLVKYPGERQTALALRLVAHTFVRTGEVRFAMWEELEGLDGDAPIWRIPGPRMKMRNEHIVPLSPQVVAIFADLKKEAGNSKFVLPAATKEGVISNNTLLYAMYRLGHHSRATVHGFRGTASTVLHENDFDTNWIERQLAHVDSNEVRSAYNSAKWLKQRRDMMLWWSNYLDAAEAKV